MYIPPFLIDEIRKGRVVLCFGAGGSVGAKNSKNADVPLGKNLGNLISDQFLGGKHKDKTLEQIALYAIGQSDLRTVQEFIKEIFIDYNPASYHEILTTFRWKALATTNYDLIIEKAYARNNKSIQKLIPFIEDTDRVHDLSREPNSLMYIKLHGCITRSNECACPLILTKEDFNTHKEGRERLFNLFEDLAHEYQIVFIGHNLEDQDIRGLLQKLRKKNISLPKNYMLVPGVDEIQKTTMQKLGIEVLEGTFEDFLKTIDQQISSDLRGLPFIETNTEMPILNHFRNPDQFISENLKNFLANDIDLVCNNKQYEYIQPNKFYKGHNLNWSPINQKLDVKRELSDDLLTEFFLYDEITPKSKLQMILVKAHAGAGKTIMLKRLAWDAVQDYQKLCLFLKEYGELNFDALKELLSSCDKKVYLFIDNASRYIKDLNKILSFLGEEANKLTIIMAERTNIWNMSYEDSNQLPIQPYELKYLNYKEADNLLNLLEKHNFLGELSKYPKHERQEKLLKNYGKQLLVVLYEITHEKTFEEIIKDEYNNIPSKVAQDMYLTVCILNRLKLPVRASIITSIYNINFNEFKEKFYGPLEDVVIPKRNSSEDEWYYEARHPYIAEIVFKEILVNKEDRFNHYLEALKPLNTLYDSDRKSFRVMIKAKSLLDIFNDHQMIVQIYNIIDEKYSDDPYVLQQKAIYEMQRNDGNLSKAKEYLAIAESIDSRDTSIKHSKAELLIKMADKAKTVLECDKFLTDAYSIINDLLKFNPSNHYCYSTLVKIELNRLNFYVKNNESDLSEPIIRDIINKIEENLFKGLQQFPSDSYLLMYNAELADLLNNSELLMNSLMKVFDANPRNSFVAMRLVKQYQENNDNDNALRILDRAIEANRAEKRLHYAKAIILFNTDEKNYRGDIIHHLSKSFVESDRNYDAKVLYGRELFLNNEFEKSKDFFLELEKVYIDDEMRNKVLYPLNKTFLGKIRRTFYTHCYIQSDEFTDDIYAHKLNNEENIWENLKQDTKVTFDIGFNMKGLTAINIKTY